jgi:hypothetical protein
MNDTLVALWQWLTPVVLSVVAYFLKDLHSRFDRDMAEQKTEIAALRGEVNALKTSMPLNYVLREDYIRNNAAITNKLDKIMEKIMEKG